MSSCVAIDEIIRRTSARPTHRIGRAYSLCRAPPKHPPRDLRPLECQSAQRPSLSLSSSWERYHTIPVRTNAKALGSTAMSSYEYKLKAASPLYGNHGRVAAWSSRRTRKTISIHARVLHVPARPRQQLATGLESHPNLQPLEGNLVGQRIFVADEEPADAR